MCIRDRPGDKYEQEADRVASQVVEQLYAPASAQSNQGQSVQRQEEKKEELQAKSILQRREEIAVGEASTDLESAINSARGSGQPLDAGLQQSMGQAMGADFSGVKVHTDAQADQLNQSVQAKAFTTGQDVFFRQGAYQPGSRGGQELIAHELTHVVQQNGGELRTPEKDGDPSNQESKENISLAGGVISLQKKTATEFSKETGVPHSSELESITHERVDMTTAERNAAKVYWANAGFGLIPTRTVCNHHIPYKEVRDKVREALVHRKADEVAWRLSQVALSVLPNETGFNRQEIENSIDELIASTANNPKNLFYWPDTTGDDGGNTRDNPAFSDNYDIKQLRVRGELVDQLRAYDQSFEDIMSSLTKPIS